MRSSGAPDSIFSAMNRAMGYPLQLALRYMGSKKRGTISVSTAFAILGVVLGVAALATIMSVTGGFHRQFRSKVLGVNAHVLVLKYSTNFREYRGIMEKVADVEGYPEVAGLFKDTADGETGHAHGHLDYLKQVGDPATGMPIGATAANLTASVAGETHEYETMYPGMAKTARDEGFNDVAEWFETLAKAEKSHAGRFAKALQNLD